MSLKTTFKLYSQTETVFSWSFSKLLFFQCLIVSNASSIRILSDLFRWLYWILWLQNMFLILKWSINAGKVEQLTMRNSIHHQQQSNYSFHVFSLLIQAAAVRLLLSKTNVCFTLNRLQCVLLASKEFKHWQVLLCSGFFRILRENKEVTSVVLLLFLDYKRIELMDCEEKNETFNIYFERHFETDSLSSWEPYVSVLKRNFL